MFEIQLHASSLVTNTNDKVSSTLVSSLATDMVPILRNSTLEPMNLPIASIRKNDVIENR